MFKSARRLNSGFFLKTSSMDTHASIFGQAQPFSGAWYGLHSDWLRCHSSRLSTSKTTSALLQGTAIFFFYIFCGINNRQEVFLCITTSNSNSGSYFHIDIPGLKNLPYFLNKLCYSNKTNLNTRRNCKVFTGMKPSSVCHVYCTRMLNT